MRNFSYTFTLLVVVACLASSANADVIVYSEDFNGFPNGKLNSMGWTEFIGAPSAGVNINGGVVVGDGSDGASANFNSFSLRPSTTSVMVEATMRSRASGGFGNLFVLTSDAPGTSLVQFGSSNAGFRIRNQTGGNFFNANIGGDDALSNSGHRFYDVRFSYDFLADTGSYDVRNQGGDSLFSTVTTFTKSDIGAAIDDPSNWAGLYLRLASVSDQFDKVQITAVPEPSSIALVGLAAVGATIRRLRRRRTPC